MESPLTAIEATGAIDEHHQLQLDGALPICGPMRVRVIVLFPSDDAWNETEWLSAAGANPAFADLGDPAEEVYSLSDGKPFNDEA